MKYDGYKIIIYRKFCSFFTTFRGKIQCLLISYPWQLVIKVYIRCCGPLIDLEESYIKTYLRQYDLPNHPLLDKHYNSVGCIHCTVPGNSRDGRWEGKTKTECGLHLSS